MKTKMSKKSIRIFLGLILIAVVSFGLMNAQKTGIRKKMPVEQISKTQQMHIYADVTKCGDGKAKSKKASKCGSGKCGDGKAKSKKASKCGSGKCGDDKAENKKTSKCGSGKCGDGKAKNKKTSKCGSGKCGDDKAKNKKTSKCGK